MQRAAGVKPSQAPPGVFDTIAAAMSDLPTRPAPLLLPIAVDLYLWLGARLSPLAVVDPLRRWVDEQQPAAVGEAQTLALTDVVAWLDRLGRTGDLAALAGWLVPSLLADAGAFDITPPGTRPVVFPPGALATVGLAALVLLLGVCGLMTFAAMLARIARGAPAVGVGFVRDSALAIVRFLGFVGLVVAVGLGVAVPATVVTAVFALFGVDLLPLLGAAAATVGLAAAVGLAFVTEAIVVADAGPLRAVSLSVGVVRRHPWPTVGLLLVLWTVLFILPGLVGRLTGSAPGTVLAIAAYAFVATGLALARVMFFADRLRAWRPDLVPPPPA